VNLSADRRLGSLPVFSYADLSSSVLPRLEMDTLDRAPTWVVRHDYGAWVHVGALDLEATPDGLWAPWPHLHAVIVAARAAGAAWVHLDRDGLIPEPGTGLTVHDW
jgi:hypothetical protein